MFSFSKFNHQTSRATHRKVLVDHLLQLRFCTEATHGRVKPAGATGSTHSTSSLPRCVPEGNREMAWAKQNEHGKIQIDQHPSNAK